MPYIPLLKTNTDLATPQVPALDRMPRPQIDVRGVLAAMEDLGRASQMPDTNPEPFVEAAGAKGKAVGWGLMTIGDVMSTLAIKRVEEGNRIGILKAQSAMETGSQVVQEHFDNHPDKPEGFVQQALAVGGKVIKGLGSIVGLDRVGSQIVTRDSGNWHRGLVTGAQVASDKQIFRNSADAQLAQVSGPAGERQCGWGARIDAGDAGVGRGARACPGGDGPAHR
jgi:hypothetical protein